MEHLPGEISGYEIGRAMFSIFFLVINFKFKLRKRDAFVLALTELLLALLEEQQVQEERVLFSLPPGRPTRTAFDKVCGSRLFAPRPTRRQQLQPKLPLLRHQHLRIIIVDQQVEVVVVPVVFQVLLDLVAPPPILDDGS